MAALRLSTPWEDKNFSNPESFGLGTKSASVSRLQSPEREADVLAGLAVALVYAGRTAAGLRAFDQALERSSGVLTGQVLHRRAIAPWTTCAARSACCSAPATCCGPRGP